MGKAHKKAAARRAQVMLQAFLRQDLKEDSKEPRVLLYGLFSDPFTLHDKRYYWATENGRLALRQVDWDESEET